MGFAFFALELSLLPFFIGFLLPLQFIAVALNVKHQVITVFLK
jgi:hypothetical protein